MKLIRVPETVWVGMAMGISWVPAVAAVNLTFVTIPRDGKVADPYGYYRVVPHDYRIAKYETTAGQYVEFLNATAKTDPYRLYSTSMVSTNFGSGIIRSGTDGSYSYSPAAGCANRPITFVSWFDAARFCNWLHNGQGAGGTETGAYTLNGVMSGIGIAPNPGALFWIPSGAEWFKAAYRDPTKGSVGNDIWAYPMRSDVSAGNTIGVPHSANYNDGDFVGYPGVALTDVGAYGPNSESYYGTADQGGNVAEWVDDEAVIWKKYLGGSWNDQAITISRNSTSYGDPTGEYGTIGFRIASVPEPGVVPLVFGSCCGALIRRRPLPTRGSIACGTPQ